MRKCEIKKAISMFLAVVLILGLLPLSAFAAGGGASGGSLVNPTQPGGTATGWNTARYGGVTYRIVLEISSSRIGNSAEERLENEILRAWETFTKLCEILNKMFENILRIYEIWDLVHKIVRRRRRRR